MCSVPIDRAAERAKLLAELANVLEQSERLLNNLPVREDCRALLIEVHIRIQAARLEIDSLRRSRSLMPRERFDPERSDFSPWTLEPS